MTARHRLLHIRVDGVFGGIERQILEQCRRLDPERFEMSVACLVTDGPLAERSREMGIQVDIVPMASRFSQSPVALLEEIILRRRIDLVVTYGVRADWLAYWALRDSSTPWIAHVPNLIYNDYPNPLKGRAFYWLDRWALRKANAVIVCAQFPMAVLTRSPFALKNIVHIPNAMDFAEYFRDTREPTLPLPPGIGDKSSMILCVGRLEPVKGQKYLIEAFSLIVNSLPQAHLLLAGDGSSRTELERLAEELGVETRIHFLGFRKDIKELLQVAAVSVSPSLHEGMPFAVMESIAMETPVVATRVGGQAEILSPWADGNLVPSANPQALADAIKRVIENPSVAREQAKEGRAWLASTYSWSQIVPKFERLYEDVIQIIDCRVRQA